MSISTTKSAIDPQREELILACRAFREKSGVPALRAMLEEVAGVTSISLVPRNKIAAVVEACGNSAPKSIDQLSDRAWLKWNSAGRKPEC